MSSLADKLNWVVQGMRPDMAFELIGLSVKFRNGIISDLKRGVKAVRKVKDGEAKVCFPALGSIEHWKLVVFSDVAHANLDDGISSMGGITLMMAGK